MRRRFIQQADGTLLEVSLDYQAEPVRHDSVLWNDRSYQDANDPRFASRSQHREFMKRNGLTTVDDFTGHFEREERRRDAFRTSAPDPSRARDIARALDG
jgi:hypothetical protein